MYTDFFYVDFAGEVHTIEFKVKRKYDALIIGGGLAGLYCARLLYGEMSIAVVTNKPVGSHKPCGGLVTEQAHNFLQKLRLEENYFSSPRKLQTDIEYGNSRIVQEFYNVHRIELEKELYTSIPGKIDTYGAKRTEIEKKRDGFSIINQENNDEYACTYVIIADGANSTYRRKMGYTNASIITAEQVIYAAKIDRAKMVIDPAVTPDYYYWIIPKDETVIVGYKIQDMDSVTADIESRFPELVLENVIGTERGLITKIQSMDEIELGNDEVFFIGEAAGLVMPSSGEGITSAFESAAHAAAALLSGEKDKHGLYRYLMKERLDMIRKFIRV